MRSAQPHCVFAETCRDRFELAGPRRGNRRGRSARPPMRRACHQASPGTEPRSHCTRIGLDRPQERGGEDQGLAQLPPLDPGQAAGSTPARPRSAARAAGRRSSTHSEPFSEEWDGEQRDPHEQGPLDEGCARSAGCCQTREEQDERDAAADHADGKDPGPLGCCERPGFPCRPKAQRYTQQHQCRDAVLHGSGSSQRSERSLRPEDPVRVGRAARRPIPRRTARMGTDRGPGRAPSRAGVDPPAGDPMGGAARP